MQLRGHDTIIEKFRAALVRSRLASTFLFVGPAGIGKSRLACEAAARASERYCIVVYGACHEGPTAPYGVIVDGFAALRLTPGIDEHIARTAF